MTKTKIEYLDYTWNPTHGCTPVSDGCRSCWAAAMSKRLAAMGVKGYSVREPFKPTCHPDRLDEPLKVKKPSVIGVSFMGDFFHPAVSLGFKVRALNRMAICKHHIFIILTKRAKRLTLFDTMHGWSAESYPNIWLGVSVEDQPTADERIPILLQVPAAVRVVSIEPMLGAVNLYSQQDWLPTLIPNTNTKLFSYRNNLIPTIDWVLCGPETGSNRRPLNTNWVRVVKNQCVEAGVPFFLKALYENGKKVSMPVLDGQVWGQMPEVPNAAR